jgi:hypothetical protein
MTSNFVTSIEYTDNLITKWVSDGPDQSNSHFSPYLYDGEKHIPLTLQLIETLPKDKFNFKDAEVYKGDTTLVSWKKRYIIVCGGMLIYFKTSTTSKPQGAIPLDNCFIDLPNDNRKSFAWKGRDGVDGYEMRITHNTRRPFLVIFSTYAQREEWTKFLREYIIIAFLSRGYKLGGTLSEVEGGCVMVKKKIKHNGDLLPSFKNHQRYLLLS